MTTVKQTRQQLIDWINVMSPNDATKKDGIELLIDHEEKISEDKFTLEDLKKAFEAGSNIEYDAFVENLWEYKYDNFDDWFKNYNKITYDTK